MGDEESNCTEREAAVRDALKKALDTSATVTKVKESDGEIDVHIISSHAFDKVAERIGAIAGSIAAEANTVLHVTLASSWRTGSQPP